MHTHASSLIKGHFQLHISSYMHTTLQKQWHVCLTGSMQLYRRVAW